MLGLNGGVLGVRNAPSPASARGIWVPNEQSLAKRASLWPADLDPNFSNVSLLLHMDGANGSTTFTDSSSNAFTMTAEGNAQISTADSKFSGASGLFDGSGDRLTAASNAAFSMGTGDFTIELWVKPLVLGTDKGFVTSLSGSASTGMTFGYTSTYGLFLGHTNDIKSHAGGAGVTLNVWQHVAVTRSSGSVRFFKNGTQVGSTSTNTFSYDLGLSGLAVGSQLSYSYSYINGYIDELRVTKGVARYTSNFTVAVNPFPNA